MPPADIFMHTGDFTNFGNDDEFQDVNSWLGTLKPRYKHIIGIMGNHDRAWKEPAYFKERLSNARLLLSENISVMGLNIFGTSWYTGMSPSNHRGFGKIPSGLDILITHGPAYNILDWCWSAQCGSSEELFENVVKAKPLVHLFGHDHEQRGLWEWAGGKYSGGVEYEVVPGSGSYWPTTGPPPDDYPSFLVSNNAMKNAGQDRMPPHIAGPARLIIARQVNGRWHFHAEVKRH